MKINFQIYFVYCFLQFYTASAQVNLIQNGSFEQYDTCPIAGATISTINYALFWSDMRADGVSEFYNSPDLFNSCDTADFPATWSVPNNWYGFQEPYHGEGYAGIVINGYPNDNYDREFMQNELSASLKKGCKYKVSFQFSYGEKSSYQTDGLYFIFSKNKLTIPSNQAMINGTFFNYNPDSVNILRFHELIEADTLNWHYFEREFYSISQANYLTIGSISDSLNTNNQFGWFTPPYGLTARGSRGYFDDIRLIQLDSTCVEDVTGGIEEKERENVKVYPNPAAGQLNISNLKIKEEFQVLLLDATGRIIQNQQFSGIGTHTLNLSGLEKGIYFCRIMQGEEVVVVEKVVVTPP